ncbi:hypothetical protein J2W32_006467 [Variovorax boronicumulans]|uniref:Uncharacterized protein n=1 Tax=Variovorax boronicumulans TaxID=436515 RepID=A0AAW8DC59_9BURK|nr:hypothetical protein [Variovorax boronicumulans]MDQ0057390.1 hypothetical protein [Variovorax boronicumulans]
MKKAGNVPGFFLSMFIPDFLLDSFALTNERSLPQQQV